MNMISHGIKIITLARGIRWFGWGLCETLIPVVLFSFSRTYVEAGLFRSVYDVVFILCLPFVSIVADRVRAKSLMLFALALYPLIGIGYFLAGAFGAGLFIILARALNGITWCCDSVGGDTYLRRFALDEHLSKSFGYLSALPNFSWMIAALASILLIPIVPIHWLFLGIVPTSIAAYLILRRAPDDAVPMEAKKSSGSRLAAVIEALRSIRLWKREIWMLAGLTFFVACLDLFGTFFLPLFTFSETDDLAKVILITVIFAIPSAFAFWFGVFIDKVSKAKFIAYAFIIAAGLLSGLACLRGFAFQAGGIFLLGILTTCLSLAIQALATQASQRDWYGKVSGIMAGAEEIGYIAGPIAMGFFIDAKGMGVTYLVFASISFVIALILVSIKKPVNFN